MPAPFGVTPTGFSRPSIQELVALMEADQRALIDPNIDTSSDGVLGQNNGIYARQLGVAWEALEAAYNGFDPDAAEGALLTALSKLTGTERRPASQSRARCDCVLEAGTRLLAGTHLAHIEGEPDNVWTPEKDFTAPSNGTFEVFFLAVATGPIPAPQGDLNVIATPVVGWTSVVNTEDAVLGIPADDDPTLRLRREQQLTIGGSATANAIRADLLELDEIQTVLMFENDGDAIDGNGLPPHSFEAVIWDESQADQDEVAQIIYDNKAAGIRSFGSLSGNATDPNGDVHPVNFSRATATDIWLEFDVVPREDYVGDAAFAQQVAARCEALFGIGDDVTFYDVLLQTSGLGARVTALRLGFAPNPTLSNDLPIGIRAIARFDSGDIVVDSTP